MTDYKINTVRLTRAISIFLITVMIFGFTAPGALALRTWNEPAQNLPFRDVPHSAWFHNNVAWAYANSITSGTTQTTFSPGGNVTRAQFATFLYRMAGSPAVSSENPFNDIPSGTWFSDAVIWAVATGVTLGTSPNTFEPHNSITREQLATMLHRYIQSVRTTHTAAAANALNNFPDASRVSTWALDAVRWAAYYGIMGTDGMINARGNASRAQTVAMLHRVANDFLTEGRTPAHVPPPAPAPTPPMSECPLTGLPVNPDVAQNRPVVVSLGNTRNAMPTNATNGISQADIVYELLVEWGETRLMALFQDFSDVPLVGSIRSVRHYTVEIAEAHDAILIHAGGSQYGIDEVNERSITSFNEVHGPGRSIFRREQGRVPGHTVARYHSAVTSGAAATQGFARYSTRTSLGSNVNRTFHFTDNPIATGGVRAHNVTVRFSGQKSSSFAFAPEQNLYTMSQHGSIFTDANDGTPVTFTNLLLLRVDAPLLNRYDGDRRLDISFVGSGTGHFVSNGETIPINWSRSSKSAQFVFTLRDGSTLQLGRGRTYIAIVPTSGANVSITFE